MITLVVKIKHRKDIQFNWHLLKSDEILELLLKGVASGFCEILTAYLSVGSRTSYYLTPHPLYWSQ